MKKISLLVAFLWLGIMGASAQEDRCDVNGDGEVNIMDVIYVVDHVLGKHEPEAIDLDLPSGTKWASFNVGATKPEEFGGYYSWGETEEKDVYNVSTSIYYQNASYANLGPDISGTEYDVAHVKWGGKWCMPTLDDIKELLDNCINEWTTLNDVKGLKFTSKNNGNSIFLPASGYHWEGLKYAGQDGHYWSSTLDQDFDYDAFHLRFHEDFLRWEHDGKNTRDYGFSVRPVLKK